MLKFDFRMIDLGAPFSLLRVLIPELDNILQVDWASSPLTRAVFHRGGNENESLSERQNPEDQLRYYTNRRVLRGLRYIARDYSRKIAEEIEISLAMPPANPDGKFLEWLGRDCELTVYNSYSPGKVVLRRDEQSDELHEICTKVRDGNILPDELTSYLSLLLSYGDSWSAKKVADLYLRLNDSIESRMGDVLGIPYALQGETAMAKVLWEKWLTTSSINESRAHYSLSMLYARHYPRALLDIETAEEHLKAAWNKLNDEPPSSSIDYEKVFNRNGMALILFRKQKFDEARSILEEGISQLETSAYGGKLHHTVLVSNLARVVQAIGDQKEAERLYKKAIVMDSKFAEYHQDYASFLCDENRFDEALIEVDNTIKLDPSMPEAHSLRGYILMQMDEVLSARDAYAEAAILGNDSAVVDALRASYEAETPEWTIDFYQSIFCDELYLEDLTEIELLLLHARASLDSNLDYQMELANLKSRFPNDELIHATIQMNTD